MKVTIEVTALQIVKACALTSCSEDEAAAVLAQVQRTPEIDLTKKCHNRPNYERLALAACSFAIAHLIEEAKKNNT